MTEIDQPEDNGRLVGVDELLESTPDESSVRRRRRWGRIAVQASVAVLAVLVLAAAGLLWQVTTSVTHSIQSVPIRGLPAIADDHRGKPMTVLLLGSDARIGADTGDGVTGQRADAIMLIRMNADRTRVDVLSIPRDSWVNVPGHGTQKINAALNWGPSLQVQTVQNLTGIQIDHVMVIDFDGVRDLTTALGGITVVNEHAITDPRNGNHFDAGPLLLSGDEALLYVRIRYGLPNGDLDRIDHQQQVIAAISEKLRSEDVLGKPLLATEIVRIVARNLTVDSGLTQDVMTRTLVDILATPPSNLHFYTAPYTGFGTSADGQSYVSLDMPLLAQACEAMRADRPLPLKGTTINIP
jgi:LCP family protein required for cell wall assembly